LKKLTIRYGGKRRMAKRSQEVRRGRKSGKSGSQGRQGSQGSQEVKEARKSMKNRCTRNFKGKSQERVTGKKYVEILFLFFIFIL
jgi:hypothetical protein